jgi:hypothetical protein
MRGYDTDVPFHHHPNYTSRAKQHNLLLLRIQNTTLMPFKRLLAARSSSGSHFSKQYRDSLVTDEPREWKFHDIPVSNDITGASTTDLLCLCVLVLLLLFKNRILLGVSTTATATSTVNTSLSVSVWVAALAISYRLREVIWIPLLSTILMTRTSYPYLVVLPHCIVACCCYRSEIDQRTKHNRVPPVFLSSFGLSFVCYGFGGSILSDLLMGLPVTALGHARIVPCYILGYLLTWYAPLDIVYTQWYQEQDKGSLWHIGLILAEAVDTVTTPLGRISRSARELQNKTTAPLVAGMLVGVGGAIIRYGERVIVQGNVAQSKPSLAALQAGVWRTLGYTLLWWYLAVYPCLTTATVVGGGGKEDHCASYDGSDDLRASIVVSYCIWTVLCQVGLVNRHPFVWFGETILVGIWSFLVNRLHLGAGAGRLVAEEEEKEAKKLN